MTEPDVTLTDYFLAAECMVFVGLLWRQHRATDLRFWFMLFFGSVSAASLFGGTVHGFFLDEQTLGAAILWPATLLATGVTSLSAWAIGAKLLFSQRVAQRVISAALGLYVLFSLVVILVNAEFWVAVVNNLPAILFLLVALVLTYRRTKLTSILPAVAGLGLTLLAAILQQLRVGIHPVYFNHNALYHVIQAVALLLLYFGCRTLVEVERNEPSIEPPARR